MNSIDLAMSKGKFYNFKYEIHRNSQHIYKMYIQFGSSWRYLKDIDIMTAISDSHVASDRLFITKKDVNEFITDYIEYNPSVEEFCQDLSVEDDFKKI